MDRNYKIGILVIAALIAFVAIGAVSVSADPADTSSAPTEDWVFDENKTTTLKSETWTVEYNMTVMNGSVLKIDGCIFTMEGLDAFNPVWIFTDVNSTLEITSSSFTASEGSSGYYIETHDNTTITASDFEGLVEGPSGNAGISVIGTKEVTAKLDFVTVKNTMSADALFFENCQVDMSNCEINNTQGGITYSARDTEDYEWYGVSIIDTVITDIEGQGIGVTGTQHHGFITVDVYNTDIWNVTEDGLYFLLGTTTGGNGNGSLWVTIDLVNLWDIGDMAMYYSSLYQQTGMHNMSSVFNATITNSTFKDVFNTGTYVQMVSTVVYFNMIMENVAFEDISLDGSFDRLGGIWWWYQSSSGGTTLSVSNSSFTRCNPAGYQIWDYGGNDIHFYNTEFIESVQAGALVEWKSGSQSPHLFEECTFKDIDGNGIDNPLANMNAGSGNPIHVYNSTFTNLTGTALVLDSQYYGKNMGFNVSGCTFTNIEGLAADLYAYYQQGTMMFHAVNTTFTNTGGVMMVLGYDYPSQTSTLDMIFDNCTFKDIIGTAVTMSGSSYYASDSANFMFVDSTIDGATGDGISVRLEVTGTSTYYKPKWDGQVYINNTVINNVGGIGISLSAGTGSAPGKRDLTINYTTIHTAQRGIFDIGFHGALWYCDIKNTLKEDIFSIDAMLSAYYCDFTQITDRKFKAYSGGQILFYYDLNIYVRWDTGAAAMGASVQLFDNKHTLIGVWNVLNPDGSLPTFTMNPFFVRETGIFSSSPYIINVTFLQVQRTIGVKLDSNKDVFIIMEDHFEPEIFILYPKSGHTQQSTLLQARGSAWDSQSGIKTVEISLDGVTWEAAEGTLRWNYTMEVNDTLIGKYSGLFLLRARAVDNANNEKIVFVQIRIDPTPPELNVDFPYDGYTTNNPDLWVRGVTEVGSKVEINGQPVPVTVSMFTHMVRLVEGPNTISVISVDPLGNIQIERMTVTLDTQVPYIILTSPEENVAMTNEAAITIEATVENDLHITINGYHVAYGSDWYPEDGGYLTYVVDLEAGENVIVIQARDMADNVRTLDRTVVYDTVPPWVQVISPAYGAVLPKPEVTVTGTIDPLATLTIQGESVTVVNGFFEITILAFEEDNSLHLAAEDAAGNTYEEYLNFTVDTKDPVLEIFTPEEDGLTVNEARYVITGTTAMMIGTTPVPTAMIVKFNGESFTRIYSEEFDEVIKVDIVVDGEGNFEIPVDLLEGKNEFTITAEDGVGNRAFVTMTIRLDTVAPTLVMYIDPIQFTDDREIQTSALTVNISGYTDPGSHLTINGITLPVSDEGEFFTPFDLTIGETTITLSSIDWAQNERIVTQTVTYKKATGETESETDTGFYLLLVAILIFLAVIFATFFYVRGRKEDMIEMEAAEATPLAPMDETVLEEPDTLPGPEAIALDAEAAPAPTTAPARPRPRSPQARRAVPRPVPKSELPDGDEKDLSEKDAEADIGADETDQEGI